ncbi:hypothetical protein B0H13DRAFT_1587263, partial [Mycena leptocephala]
GAGITVAHALAAEGFGKDLVAILKSFPGAELGRLLTVWCNGLRQELRTNSSGRLAKRQRKLADSIPDTFPDIQVAELYLNPLTSRSPEFTRPKPVAQLWRPIEPSIPQLSVFCSTHFGWHGDQLLKKLNSTLWPAIAFRMISLFYVLCKRTTNLLVSPTTRTWILKHFLLTKYKPAFADSASLELHRVRVSTDNFIQLASLDNLPQTTEADIELVSIPKVILAVAMRDASLPSTDVSQHFLR